MKKSAMTTGLELSKKLWDKGLKLETEIWWVKREEKWILVTNFDKRFFADKKACSAPSTDELLAVMPDKISKDSEDYYFIIAKQGRGWTPQYTNFKYSNDCNDDTFIKLCWGFEQSLPDALAKMCLWLFDNDYVYDQEKKMLLIRI
jgi:hypothetical protein